MERFTRLMRIKALIKRLAENALDDNNMNSFLHHAFRYNRLHYEMYPGSKPSGPGDLLNDIIEERIFNSKY